MKPKLIILIIFIFHGAAASGAGAGELSASLKYGHSLLFADYADPGSAISADIAFGLNKVLTGGFQFSYNTYEPLPACEVFGGDCRWDKEGVYSFSEYFIYLRLNTPHLKIIPGKGFIMFGPCRYDIHQDITYTREGVIDPDRTVIRRDIERIGFVAGGGIEFDQFNGFSIEFCPVLKVVDEMEEHLDIYLGLRYRFN